MLRGLWKLTWLEIKIFVREPLGVVGTIGIPVLLFVVLGRALGSRIAEGSARARAVVGVDIPVFGAVLIALSAVLSLVTIMAIYREGGILKRLRATPLRPHTILAAHVLAKLLMTAVTLALMVLAGRRFYPLNVEIPVAGFTVALLLATVSIMSVGFLIASLVPTARFAQPIASLIFYPMIAVSGLFVPVAALPSPLQVVAHVVPLTYAVSLLRGVLKGEAWLAHAGDLAALAVILILATALSAKVFRWE